MAFGGESAESYYDEGLTASMRGDLQQAITHFEKAIHLDHSFAGAYHQLGKAYHRIGQSEKAILILGQVVAKKPRLIPPRIDLAYALIDQNKIVEARELLAEANAIKPGNNRTTLGLALCAYLEGQHAACIQMTQEVIALGGTNFTAFYLLARAAKATGQIPLSDEAVNQANKLLDNSIEAAPDAPEGYFLRAELGHLKGELANALDNYRAAEDRSDPTRHYATYGEQFTKADILARHGECLEQLGQTKEAKEMGAKVLELNPDHATGQRLAAL